MNYDIKSVSFSLSVPRRRLPLKGSRRGKKAKRRETERVFVRSFSPRKVEKVSVRAYEEVSFPVQVELW